MIRGNYSLAKDVRKSELKQKQKLQQRQKNAHKTNTLLEANPILIYFSIQKLEKSSDLNPHQQKRLAKLRDDWAFIRKNNLHKEKLGPFLEKQDKERVLREAKQNKLKGKESIYFNPELNPLGRVPMDGMTRLPNLSIPIKKPYTYQPDPIIAQLRIKTPEGQAPRFYKHVQNISFEKASGLSATKDKVDGHTSPCKRQGNPVNSGNSKRSNDKNSTESGN